jgi:hypothetical protein
MKKPLSFKSISNCIYSLFTVEQWNIGYIDQSIEKVIEEQTQHRIHWLLSPSRKEYFADPFPIKLDKLFLCFEKFDRALGRGSIFALCLDQEARRSDAEQIMVKPHHLSYPFIFEHGGEIYMIPEEWGTGRITLYKCTRFPSEWEAVSVILDNVKAVDASLFQFNGMWWLSFSPREDQFASLLLYYSDSLFGHWLPHQKNPVKTDQSSARPAGRPFLYKGNLIRPAQDCGATYGGRVVLNQIVKLTPDDFEEKPIKSISPHGQHPYNKGIHTFNPVDNIVIVDGKRYILSLYGLKKTLKKYGHPELIGRD